LQISFAWRLACGARGGAPPGPARRVSSYRLWLFLTATSIKDGGEKIAILGEPILRLILQRELLGVANCGWLSMKPRPHIVLECDMQSIEDEIERLGLRDEFSDAIIPFLNDDQIRERFVIMEAGQQ
jgi:hypothetical protein